MTDEEIKESAERISNKLIQLAKLESKFLRLKGIEPTKDNQVCSLCPYQKNGWDEEPCANNCNIKQIYCGD